MLDTPAVHHGAFERVQDALVDGFTLCIILLSAKRSSVTRTGRTPGRREQGFLRNLPRSRNRPAKQPVKSSRGFGLNTASVLCEGERPSLCLPFGFVYIRLRSSFSHLWFAKINGLAVDYSTPEMRIMRGGVWRAVSVHHF